MVAVVGIAKAVWILAKGVSEEPLTVHIFYTRQFMSMHGVLNTP